MAQCYRNVRIDARVCRRRVPRGTEVEPLTKRFVQHNIIIIPRAITIHRTQDRRLQEEAGRGPGTKNDFFGNVLKVR